MPRGSDISPSSQKHYQWTPVGASPSQQTRWTSLDLARGFAILLMVLSHCVKGLLSSAMIPSWGIMPVHLMTKFSSSLFIVVFGMGLSLYFVPHLGRSTWPKKRLWMIKRGLELMVWYKLLTIVQMFQFYPQSMIVDTLLFKRMPDFVEILCFYSIVLLWIPFALPIWVRSPWFARVLSMVAFFALGQWLHYNFDFWGLKPLKAILVEEKGFYTFGQFQRGALVLFGILIGDVFKYLKSHQKNEAILPSMCIAGGALLLSCFYINNMESILTSLNDIAHNRGKHPFNLNFFCFSIGGALVFLGSCLLANLNIKKVLKPISFLGQHSLPAFILHIVVIFYFYRYYFHLHRKVSYLQSLGLTLGCLLFVILTMFTWNKLKERLQ